MVYVRGNEKTKEELLNEIDKLQQRINDLEKLQNKFQNVNEETERYPDSLEEPATTCTLELTNVNKQLLQGVNSPQKAEDTLLEIEEGFKKVTSVLTDAVIIADEEGRIVFWNKAAEKIYGYSSEETLGRLLTSIIISPEYHEAFKKGFAHFKKFGEGPIIGKTLEFNSKKKDGTRLPIE